MKFSKSALGAVAALSLTVVSAFASVPAQTSSCNYMFSTNLRMGAVSTDVQNLQKLLNMNAATKVSATGAGSMGYETLRFGPATMKAVKAFQAANGITPMSGYVGPLTRAALNTICTGSKYKHWYWYYYKHWFWSIFKQYSCFSSCTRTSWC